MRHNSTREASATAGQQIKTRLSACHGEHGCLRVMTRADTAEEKEANRLNGDENDSCDNTSAIQRTNLHTTSCCGQFVR